MALTDRVDLAPLCHATTMVEKARQDFRKRGCSQGETSPVRLGRKRRVAELFRAWVAFQYHTRVVCQRQCVSLPTVRKTQRPPLDLFGWRGGKQWASSPGSFCCCRSPPTQSALGQGQKGIRWTMRSRGGRQKHGDKEKGTHNIGRWSPMLDSSNTTRREQHRLLPGCH